MNHKLESFEFLNDCGCSRWCFLQSLKKGNEKENEIASCGHVRKKKYSFFGYRITVVQPREKLTLHFHAISLIYSERASKMDPETCKFKSIYFNTF